jgi:hypothetical protein
MRFFRIPRVAPLLALAGGALCLWLGTAPAVWAQQRPQLPAPGEAQSATITTPVVFRVFSAKDWTPVANAQIAVIDPAGRVLRTGRTNAQGTWEVPLTVMRDPRFPEMGAVTAIAVARGYNETVVFQVPVKPNTVQPVTLWPIVPGLRNEPTSVLGNMHRLDVIDFVNRYARMLGWIKQEPIPGEQGYSPWGPGAAR